MAEGDRDLERFERCARWPRKSAPLSEPVWPLSSIGSWLGALTASTLAIPSQPVRTFPEFYVTTTFLPTPLTSYSQVCAKRWISWH